MTFMLLKCLLGLAGSGLIARIAYLKKLLTISGSLATILIGTTIAVAGSWPTWGLIILFFSSSTLVGLFKKKFHLGKLDSITEKQHARDAVQVLANSLPALLSLVAFAFTQQPLFLVGYVAGIAGATSDTLASEIGILSPAQPISLQTFKRVEAGLSGGITLLGTLASLVGSGIIASAFYFLFSINQIFSFYPIRYVMIILLSGFINSIFDSFLGAFFQGKYRNNQTLAITEKQTSHEINNHLIAGFSWMTNDLVNFLSGLLTILFSFILFNWFC